MLYFLIQLGDSFSAIELFAFALAYFLAICVAMTIHEWAHAYTAYKCGDSTAKLCGRMTLNPFAHFSLLGLLSFFLIGFGWAKPVPINPVKFRNYKKNGIWVISSGVLANFILAFVFAGLWMFLGGILLTEYLVNSSLICFFLYYLIQFCLILNIVLFLFNLLPIPPLDGFNLVQFLTKWNNKFVGFMQKYGLLFLVIFLLPIFNGYSLLTLFYNYAIPLLISYFCFFWGLFL